MPEDDLTEPLRLARIVTGALIGAVLGYAAIIELLGALPETAPTPEGSPVRYVFLAVIAGTGVAIVPLRNFVLAQPPPGGTGTSAAGRLLSASIASAALCESVAILGFTLFFLMRERSDFYIPAILSLGLFAIHFPRRERWEEWRRKRRI